MDSLLFLIVVVVMIIFVYKVLIERLSLHKGTKCDMRFKSSLNSARLNLLNPYK